MRRLLTITRIMFLLGAVVFLFASGVAQELPVAFAQNDYASNPVPGSAIPITAIVGANGTATIVISDGNGGAGAGLTIEGVTQTGGSPPISFALSNAGGAVATPYNVSANGDLTITITCSPTIAGTFNATLNVDHDDAATTDPATYTVNCESPLPQYQAINFYTNQNLNPNDTVVMNSMIDEANPPGLPTQQDAVTIQNGAGAPTGSRLTGTLTLQPGDNRIKLINPVGGAAVDSLNFGVPNGLSPGQAVTIAIQCDPSDDIAQFTGLISRNLEVTTNAGDGSPNSSNPIIYTIQCDVVGTADFNSVPVPGTLVDVGSTINPGITYNPQAVEFVNLNANGALQMTFAFSGVDAGVFRAINPGYVENPNNPDTVIPPSQVITSLTIPANDRGFVQLACDPSTDRVFNATFEVTYIDLPLTDTNAEQQVTVTYPVTCEGTPPLGTFASSPYPPNDPGTINMGTVSVGSSIDTALTIFNTGFAALGFDTPSFFFTGTNANAFSLVNANTLIPYPANSTFAAIAQGGINVDNLPLLVRCTPTTAGPKIATLTIDHNNDSTGSTQAQFNFSCNGATGGPIYSSVPAVNSTINITASIGSPGTSNIVITNTGQAPLTLNTANFPNNGAGTLSVTINGAPINNNTIDPANSLTAVVSCSSNVPGSYSSALNITHSSATTVSYTVNCTVNQASNATYTSNPAPGPVNLNTSLGGSTSQTISITNTGSGPLQVASITTTTNNATQVQVTTIATPFTVGAGATTSNAITINCSSTTAGTYTATIAVAHNASGSPANYTVSCVVSSATATPQVSPTPTALPPISGSSVTQCQENLVLSTPFPQNASGEFLLVNCFIVNTAGTVNVSLSQVLTNPYSGVTSDRLVTIQQNAGIMSVWRMGSWFLVPSTYNAATQTYTFESAAGTNVYAFFYGAITEPVGAQTTSFAGTTTGNVEDAVEVIVDDANNNGWIAALLSSGIILAIGVFYLFRRRRLAQAEAEA